MPLNLASPGIVVREIDLTLGRVIPSSNKTGAIVAPFAKGPVDEPTLVENENDLLTNFGEPYSTDKHYEHWLSASSYLAYGGSLRVVRADNTLLRNGFVGPSTSSIKIKSLEHYDALGYDENTLAGVVVAARNPGSWSNGLRVAIIDSKADQTLSGINTGAIVEFVEDISNLTGTIVGSANTIGISTDSITLGLEVRCDTSDVISTGTTVIAIGNGVITISNSSEQAGIVTATFDFGTTTTSNPMQVGYGIEQSVAGKINPGAGSTSILDGYLKGIITKIGESSIDVKILSHVSEVGTETQVDYQPLGTWAFSSSGSIGVHTNGQSVSYGTTTYTSRADWFDQQTIGLTTSSSINWNTIAPRPATSAYAAARNSRFDEVHVVVIDALGSITGNAGSIIEKHLGLSKATDAEFSVGSPSYWRKYLVNNSKYIFGLGAPAGIVTTAYSESDFTLASDVGWDQEAEGIIFAATGSSTNILAGGKDYGGIVGIGSTGALTASLGKLSEGYDLFENTDNYTIDFLLMGSAAYNITTAQALANKLISVAELRKDAIAFISPYRGAALTDTLSQTEVNINSAVDITTNVLSFYASVASSSYAVFDSGYKYMYDRFSNTYRYVPLNGDIAGLCARNDINNFPWYSPAGTTRGSILNAVKLAYNPSKTQRDKLYSNRINPVIFSPGSGIILFGDKTGLARASAFDRINVRRLFVYLEDAISRAAKDALFEFNDEVTRTNFVNTIEPFLRDVQAKRGIFNYIVICDETNNTAAVIDNNEFVADIYVKPARSINFIGLNFIATKTGVDFEEVIGNF